MKEDGKSRSLDKFVLRLPDGMRERIAMRAKINARSMNSEIVSIIEAMTADAEVQTLRRLIMMLLMNDVKVDKMRQEIEDLTQYRSTLLDEIKEMETIVLRKHQESGAGPAPNIEEMMQQVAAELDAFEDEMRQ